MLRWTLCAILSVKFRCLMDRSLMMRNELELVEMGAWQRRQGFRLRFGIQYRFQLLLDHRRPLLLHLLLQLLARLGQCLDPLWTQRLQWHQRRHQRWRLHQRLHHNPLCRFHNLAKKRSGVRCQVKSRGL